MQNSKHRSSSRISSLLIFSTIFLLIATAATAQNKQDKNKSGPASEIVRISYLQGDVRVSQGDGKRAEIDKSWQQAKVNLPMGMGFSLATGAGRAEVELENGSMIYLADNSVLIFEELDSKDGTVTSVVRIVTGTMTLSFDPEDKETFTVHTPSDELTFNKKSYLRVDSFLDATSVTPLEEGGEDVVRHGLKTLHLSKGQTITTRNGLALSVSGMSSLPVNLSVNGNPSDTIRMKSFSEDDRQVLAEVLSQYLLSHGGISTMNGFLPPGQAVPSPAPADWDNWVEARLVKRNSEIALAEKAAGVTQFMPGITDLYEQGVFFPCEGYGQCWEPRDQHDTNMMNPVDPADDAETQTILQPAALRTGAQQQASGQQPGGQTKKTQQLPPLLIANRSYEYLPMADCSDSVLRITYEVDPKTGQRREISRDTVSGFPYFQTWSWGYCHAGDFIRLRGRYVLVPHRKHHHPPVCWVHIGKKIGYVPRHPHDGKGKPPINMKHGVLQPTGKRGGTITRVTFNPSEKFKLLERAPKEFQARTFTGLPHAERPQIPGHFRNENLPGTGPVARGIVPGTLAPRIQYDYKSHQFVQTGPAVAGHTAPPIPVGTMNPHGGIEPGRIVNPGNSDRSAGGGRTGSGNSGGTPSASHGSGGGYGGGGSVGGGGSSGGSGGGSHGGGSSGGGGGGGGSSGGGGGGGGHTGGGGMGGGGGSSGGGSQGGGGGGSAGGGSVGGGGSGGGGGAGRGH